MTDAAPRQNRLKRMLQELILGLLILLFLEVMAATALFHVYNLTGKARPDYSYRDGRWAFMVLLSNFASAAAGKVAVDIHVEPAPFYSPDPVTGFAANPGTYTFDFERRHGTYRWQATIGPDRGRRTAVVPATAGRAIYIFGDSVIFGYGLNDEQTMAALLQAAMPEHRVHNYAVPGWGMLQSYLRFMAMRDAIGADDIVIFGYADYFGERELATGPRLRSINSRAADYSWDENNPPMHPYLNPADASFAVHYLPIPCALNNGSCYKPQPPLADMKTAGIRIIDQIAAHAKGRVYIASLSGIENDPVTAQARQADLALIDLKLDNSEFFANDDVYGFEPHPGALAHYNFYRRVYDALNDSAQ